MDSFLNIAAYRFVTLQDPPSWRDRIHAEAAAQGLKGTVLVSAEGLNLVLAGPRAPVRAFLAWLTGHAPFDGLRVHESRSEIVPFDKLLVRHKREIIRMNEPTVRPQDERAASVDAATLSRWLDAGHDDLGMPVALLDTRNGFEVDAGRLRGAIDWRLRSFGDFPQVLLAHRSELAGKTVVSYCTGGIRCEKAALWMRDAGVDRALQLDGGLLGYLSQTDGRHFEGHCFVFDQRVALDARLAPSGTALAARVAHSQDAP